MSVEFIELITKIESCTRDLANAAQINGNQSVESDLNKIIKASTIFNRQIIELTAQITQNNSLHSILSDSIVKHDIRTPMNAILGYSEILIEESEQINIKNFIASITKIHDFALQLLSLIDNFSNQASITGKE